MSSGPGICPTPGCKGIGHIKGPKFNGHHRWVKWWLKVIDISHETMLYLNAIVWTASQGKWEHLHVFFPQYLQAPKGNHFCDFLFG